MNYAIVFRLLGYVLMIEGALLLLPAAASLVYGEWMVLGVFPECSLKPLNFLMNLTDV